MRVLAVISLLFSSSLFVGCGETTSPSGSNTGKTITMDGYGSYIEPAYYKVWSDSSWEEFGRITTIDSVVYATIVDNTGFEYYYSSGGYAGFQVSGGSVILFDSAMQSLPDTLVFGKTYSQRTTFRESGTVYVMKVEQTLQDTGAVTVPFGKFTGCLWIKSTSTFSGGGQSNVSSSEYWLAKGPSELKRRSSSGAVTLMDYGYVNGQSWGEGLPKRSTKPSLDFKIRLLPRFINPLLRR